MTKFKKLINIVVGLGILLIIWELVVLTGRYESSLLPSPLTVLKALKELIVSGILFIHIKVSLLRFFAGYSFAVIIASTTF